MSENEDPLYDVTLVGFATGVDSSAALQAAFGVSQAVADDFISRMPCVVKSSAAKGTALEFQNALEEVGAQVTMQRSGGQEPLPRDDSEFTAEEPLDLEPLEMMEPRDLRVAKARPIANLQPKASASLPTTSLAYSDSSEGGGLSILFSFLRRFRAPILLLGVVGAIAWWWTSEPPPVIVGPKPIAAQQVVVMLHGFGAPQTDLRGLAQELRSVAPDISFILPAGPHSAGMGRAWYPNFRASSEKEYAAELRAYRAEAREVVMDIVDDLVDDGYPPGSIYVGGFSQGGFVALDVILTERGASELGGLIFLSGNSKFLDFSQLAGRQQIRAFVSHGTSDEVIGVTGTDRLVEALKAGGHETTYVRFKGGHRIHTEVRQGLATFIHEL